MHRISWAACGAFVASLAPPVMADDAPIRASLQWTRKPGAESCIDELGLRTAVESRLERAVFVPTTRAELLLVGEVEPGPDASGWRVVIRATDLRGTVLGEREVVTDRGECNELVDSLAIVMALSVDSSRRSIRIHVPVRPPPPLTEPWRADIGPDASAFWGVMPGTGLAAGLRTSILPPHFVPLELVWTGSVPHRQQRDGAGADYVGWQAAALMCPRLTTGDLISLSICGGGQVGLLRATGVGLDVPRSATSQMGWFVGRGSVLFGSGRVRPRLGVSALVPLVRDKFVYDEAGTTHELYRPWPVALSVDVGVAVRIP